MKKKSLPLRRAVFQNYGNKTTYKEEAAKRYLMHC